MTVILPSPHERVNVNISGNPPRRLEGSAIAISTILHPAPIDKNKNRDALDSIESFCASLFRDYSGVTTSLLA
jgi:hypothetical protein